ncbi:endonuclease/exonuclease/phosphatase family protein [Myxococcota bacterium]|nr:endonuclease/exonuclease/phosphatase family protein [Myxococcota bacterium]
MPPAASRVAVLLASLAPGLAALGLFLVGLGMPQDRILGHVLQAALLSAVPWALLLGLPTCLWLLRAGRPLRVLPALVAYLLCLGPPPGCAAGTGEGLVVVSANLDAYSEGPPGAEQALAGLAPDVLLTIERRAEVVPGLLRVADNYPVPMARPSHGHAVHCRPGLSCPAAITPEFGSASTVMPAGLLRVELPGAPGGRACVLSVHAPPPAPKDPSGLHPYMARVASQLREGRLARQWGPCLAGDPALVVGDFNTVPGSPAWARLRAAGLRPAEPHLAPWQASWPAGGGWPDLPFFALDQAMVGPDLRVEGLRRVRIPGADHKALVFRLRAG